MSLPDFHRVPVQDVAIHKRLENWAAHLRRHSPSQSAPMWRYTRIATRMWHVAEAPRTIDQRDAQVIEHGVRTLPTYHREALRWHYVFQGPPARVARRLNVSYDALDRLVRDGRVLLCHVLGA